MSMAISVLLFVGPGWSFVKPLNPSGALSLIGHHQPVKVFTYLIAFSLIVTIMARIISGRHGKGIAPLALPAGLVALSFMSPGFDKLLIDNLGNGELAGLFYRLAAYSLLWFVPVVLAYILSHIFINPLVSLAENDNSQSQEPAQKSEKSTSSGKKTRNLLDLRWVQNLLALASSCILAFILLKLFIRSGQVRAIGENQEVLSLATPASKGQIIFGLTAAFLLSVLAVQQIFNASLWCYLAGPPIIAVSNYLIAASLAGQGQMAGLSGSSFVLSPMITAAILPVQYIGVGVLSVYWGYWLSLQARLSRGQLLTTLLGYV